MSGRAADRPGPSSYAVDELVEVKLRRPDGEMAYYSARVFKQSRTRLHVRVGGSGTEVALTRWDVRLFVRRPGESGGNDGQG